MAAIENDYVSQAERVIRGLPKVRNDDIKLQLTTSQLRNLLSLTAQLYDEATLAAGTELSPELKDKVQYLRVRFVYQAGREPAVRVFVQQAKLLEALAEIGTSREKLLQFCQYMEALVAYKKFLDPKDS